MSRKAALHALILAAAVPALLFLASHRSARGGNGEVRGGGDAFVCASQTKAYFADTYHLVASRTIDLKGFENWDIAAARDMVASLVGVLGAPDAEVIRDAILAMRPQPNPNLPELDDDLIKPEDIPVGCEKRQLGIQYASSGVIEYQPDWYRLLSAGDKAMFFLHEGYIRAYLLRTPGANDTTKVREAVAKIAASGEFKMLAYQLLRAGFSALPAALKAAEWIAAGDWKAVRKHTRIDWLSREEELLGLQRKLKGIALEAKAMPTPKSMALQPIYDVLLVRRDSGETLAKARVDCLDPEDCKVVSIH
jgi:hypothetical protein